MKNRRTQFFVATASFIIGIGMIRLFIFMRDIYQKTEETTVYYTATVTDVEITGTEMNISVSIYVKEFDNFLYISNNIASNINLDDIRSLAKGQTIIFGIDDAKVSHMDEDIFVDIISLKTDSIEVFSLADYNRYMHNSFRVPRIVCAVVAILLLYVSIVTFRNARKAQNR